MVGSVGMLHSSVFVKRTLVLRHQAAGMSVIWVNVKSISSMSDRLAKDAGSLPLIPAALSFKYLNVPYKMNHCNQCQHVSASRLSSA